MNILYIHASYKPSDLIGEWFRATKDYVKKENGNAWFAIKYKRGVTNGGDIKIGDSLSNFLHIWLHRWTGLQDMWSCFATIRFLWNLEKIKPDIIHCHVINDRFLNLALFVRYVNKRKIKVVWTFHDSRVLTGKCPCPGFKECIQWKTLCTKCPTKGCFICPGQKGVDMVSIVHKYRMSTVGEINNLTIVAPSNWMRSMVEQSYLKGERCCVIHNGINLSVFHPSDNDVKSKYNIPHEKIMLLSVGNPIWTLKGREYLLKLAEDIPENYMLVLVGAESEDVRILQKNKKVIALPRVNRNELIDFYSSADLFVYPTLADNFPTVCLEAQACGCPVVAFDSEGTSETIAPGGVVVPRGDYVSWKEAIYSFNYIDARKKAIEFARKYSQERCIEEYMALYKAL